MLASKIWNYIKGYVIILVEGTFIEKFINICARRKVTLWDLQKTGQFQTVMKTGIGSFKRIRPASRKSGCRVRILKKCGLPFLVRRYRKRKAFALGILVFAGILNVMAMFIWDIRVEGAGDKVEISEITQILDDMGIRLGTVKYGIEPGDISNTIMLKLDELAWCGVELRGTKLNIRIKERHMPPDVVPVEVPCDIVARIDGLIESMDVKSGQELVKPGDIVRKGQVLVSGTIKSRREEDSVMFVHAIASIRARTWYEGIAEAGPVVVDKEITGKQKVEYYLEIFGRKFRIPVSRADFERYELTETIKRLTIGKNLVLPLGVTVKKYTEYREMPRAIDDVEARQIAGDNAYRKALANISESADIVATQLDFEKTENAKTRARVLIECVEDIGIEQKIGGK